MKMVIRADDAGYTHVHNLATFDTVDRGYTTSVDLMMDTPGAVEAMRWLRERPWISVGWHNHFWGRPVLPAEEVPTLFDPVRGHFRQDLAGADDISFDEAVHELRAQIELCRENLGRAPDTVLLPYNGTVMSRAIAQVAEEYGIVSNYTYARRFGMAGKTQKDDEYLPPASKWQDRSIYITNIDRNSQAMRCLRSDSLREQAEYDPMKLWTEDGFGLSRLPKDCTAIVVLHPGNVDHYVYKEGDITDNGLGFMTIRVMDAHCLCSRELHDWLIDNKIELINQRDALYGTDEYQQYLKSIGSDLYMG